ncbi:gephyrin-like molybdotransferase Glp [Homoserinibacter sp. GY 40078]|uniref:molybdopterin molybdotransferase MoeA n=1 Tax=Homoserinibacter sp. GY 40078 TaxID=2603275 RepID=UPI0011CA451A|nr:gephyrin-like molybdotransferase Glp [Homoserinibacter sp. GY 40078]TXK18570.1 molybdopterin molybdotransferase MoeA [Homoserinibacter sp. GY 40078]
MQRIPVEDYAARIAALVEPVLRRPSETVALDHALDRVLAADVRTPIDLPPFRNSQMDGYAVRAADLADAPAELAVAGAVPAGVAAPSLPAGVAMKVMTGAPLPDGADAVVPVEAVEQTDGRVRFAASVPLGAYVREAGSDLPSGGLLLSAGVLLQARHLGALAAAGVRDVPVRERIRVAVISTGRELVEPGESLADGQIPDANGVALAAAVRADGAQLVAVERVGDDPRALQDAVARVREAGAELVVTSGGISMGDYEPVRALLETVGGTVGTVEMQPGGPQAHGAVDGMPVVAFPGNPVSAQISFALFLSPALREAAALPPRVRDTARLSAPISVPPGRRRFLRARRTDEGVEPVGGVGSHLAAALAAADVLLDIPATVGDLPAGARVDTVAL